MAFYKEPAALRRDKARKKIEEKKLKNKTSSRNLKIKLSKERMNRYKDWSKDGGRFPTKSQLKSMISEERSNIRKLRLQEMLQTGSKLAKKIKSLGGGPAAFVSTLFAANPLGTDETATNIQKVKKKQQQAKTKKGAR
tara:strand:- start:64 stop:477 length:414 start_codon:yes stop_codon:yes gene_type:complete